MSIKKQIKRDLGDEGYCLDDIKRFSNYPVLFSESVSQHSWWVCYYTNWLTTLMGQTIVLSDAVRLACMIYATMHDYSERSTGDISHELKYFHGDDSRDIYSALEGVENNFEQNQKDTHQLSYYYEMKNSIGGNNEFFVMIKSIVKVADWMACIKHEQREYDYGNRRFEALLDHSRDSLSKCIAEMLGNMRKTLKVDTEQMQILKEKIIYE